MASQLIQVPQRTIWRRDPGVQEMINTLNRPKFRMVLEAQGRDAALNSLSHAEFEAVKTEMILCQNRFEYAARNYFWVVDKDDNDLLLKPWESQELVLEEMKKLKDKGRAQRVMVLKARQLGISTLVEALIAWTTMFFSNKKAMVVSNNSRHAADLFGKMLHIYDMLPWWLKPMYSSLKFEEGMIFENPDINVRETQPGLNSKVIVQSAEQYGGIGQGYTISAAHLSEICDWSEDRARETMEGDLDKAIPQRPTAFAVWESTAKGAGSYSHILWRKNVELFEAGKIPKWTPIFLPWFFEKTQVMAPECGWRPEKQEVVLRERVKSEWVR
jgi:hypothetical protein